MDITALTTLITNIGFAAAAYIMLFQWMKEREKNTNDTISKLTEVINNNTIAIQRLTDKTEEHFHNDGDTTDTRK